MTELRDEDVHVADAEESSPVIVEDPLTKPAATPGEWLRVNLFSNWANTLVTIVFAILIAWVVFQVSRFVFVNARWEIVRVNLASFMVGSFPRGELMRAATGVVVISFASGLGFSKSAHLRSRADRIAIARMVLPVFLLIAVVLSFTQTTGPAIVVVASAGAFLLGRLVGMKLPPAVRRYLPFLMVAGIIAAYGSVAWFGGVGWNAWGGLMLNMFLAVAAITLCFPFGVLLALGRRSSFPAVRLVCVIYIELIRGVPLIALLLMGQTMLGFFLPVGMSRPGSVTRSLVALTLFAAAYVAEDVRGGLQSIPKGQAEASTALGMSPLRTTFLIVLPQALRNVIPALVGQFISLTKDTALVSIIGLTEVLRVARVVTSQPGFSGQGLHAETLLFAAFCFWTICFTMSRASQRLEKQLGVGTR